MQVADLLHTGLSIGGGQRPPQEANNGQGGQGGQGKPPLLETNLNVGSLLQGGLALGGKPNNNRPPNNQPQQGPANNPSQSGTGSGTGGQGSSQGGSPPLLGTDLNVGSLIQGNLQLGGKPGHSQGASTSPPSGGNHNNNPTNHRPTKPPLLGTDLNVGNIIHGGLTILPGNNSPPQTTTTTTTTTTQAPPTSNNNNNPPGKHSNPLPKKLRAKKRFVSVKLNKRDSIKEFIRLHNDTLANQLTTPPPGTVH